jgi:hypothetical protein
MSEKFSGYRRITHPVEAVYSFNGYATVNEEAIHSRRSDPLTTRGIQ